MRTRRTLLDSTALVVVFTFLCLSLPTSPALAGWIPTRATMVGPQAKLVQVIERDEIASSLASLGIDPAEAARRAAGLSDQEARQALDRLDALPAGGSLFGTILVSAVIVFIVLLVTDILGYTDVFPFVQRTAQ